MQENAGKSNFRYRGDCVDGMGWVRKGKRCEMRGIQKGVNENCRTSGLGDMGLKGF